MILDIEVLTYQGDIVINAEEMIIEENIFDINQSLKKVFLDLKKNLVDKEIDLIFEMGKNIPREFKGNALLFEKILTSVLSFVYKHTNNDEIILSLTAPEDFLYEENISFGIMNTDITKEKIVDFIDRTFRDDLAMLDGKVIFKEDSEIHFDIPFTIGELGLRRHYRLPSKSMLDKKVLLIVKSKNITHSIIKMFKYFPYDVNIGLDEYEQESNDLEKYDLLVIEDQLLTASFYNKIQTIHNRNNLKFAILTTEDSTIDIAVENNNATYLLKPVTQESVFELIIELFEDNILDDGKTELSEESEDRTLEEEIDDDDILGMRDTIEEKKLEPSMVLNIQQGLENSKVKGLRYEEELIKFLDTFGKSDLYFRQIVNEKASEKIKEFCIDLDKQSKTIGAENMLKFADIVSLIFVYDKLDMLPIYPGRYHIELGKLIGEIKKYLHIR